MLLESQDVAGKRCPSPFNSTSSSAIDSPTHTGLPHLSRRGIASDSVGYQCSRGARSWLQHSHIQRDEAEPARRATREWKNRNWQAHKTHTSASAMVLARRRKCNEQRKLRSGLKQSADSDGSETSAGDGERDSLDMEEQLTAFVEYHATDMESLDINPSQDFDGVWEMSMGNEVGDCELTHRAGKMLRTVGKLATFLQAEPDQFQDEASEYFDNVIYAPPTTSIRRAGSTFLHRKSESSCSFLLKKATATSEKSVMHGPLSDGIETSLSDGFDVAVNLVSAVKPTVQRSSSSVNASSMIPNVAFKAQWRQRRSVKRDCSLIDTSSNYSVNGKLLLAAPPTPITTSNPSSERVIELKDGCFDSSDDAREVHVWRNEVSCSVSPFLPETKTVLSSSLNAPSSLPIGFQPRLARKRRKVGQQTLDGFFRPIKH